MLRWLSALCCLLTLAGCDAASNREANELVARATPHWRALPDNSKFAIVDAMPQGNFNGEDKIAVRCWPDNRCIFAQYSLFETPMLRVVITEDGPPRLVTFPESGSYYCYSLLGHVHEIIRRGDSPLVTNRVAYDKPAWSQTYVETYIRDNGLNGDWFDCGKLLGIIEAGSLETISTTSISRSMFP